MRYLLTIVLSFLFASYSSAQNAANYEKWETEFKADTARIEQTYRGDTDYTTLGMVEAYNKLDKDYDELLNKYYKILINYLNDEEKKALRISQRNWIKFRDSEYNLMLALREKAYEEAGGGTVWGVVLSQAKSKVTRQRAFEIYNLLMFGDLGGR